MAIGQDDGSIILSTKVDTAGLSTGMTSMRGIVSKLGGVIAAAFSAKMIVNFAKESKNLYKIQMQNEVKLATVMRQRMNATDEQIQKVMDLASAEQELGIIGDEVQLAGLQQLATFAKQQETIESLLPAMNNLIAQQYGFEASTESARNVANLMGKVLQGQTGALTRVGITFTEAQEQVLKYGDESEKAATLAQVITDNVGEMNKALAKTDIGRQQQLSNTIGDIKERFGEVVTQIEIFFLPLLQKLAEILSKIAVISKSVTNRFFNGGKENEAEWKSIENNSNKTAENIEEQAENQKDLNKELKKSLAGFDEINLLSNSTEENMEDVAAGMNAPTSAGVFEAADAATDTTKFELRLKQFAKKAVQILKPIASALGRLFEPLKRAFGGIKGGVFEPFLAWVDQDFLPALSETVASAINSIADGFAVIEQPLSRLWNNAIKPIFEDIGEFVTAALGKFNEGFAYLSEKINEYKDDIEVVINGISALLQLIWAIIKPIISSVVDGIFPVLQTTIDFIFSIIRALSNLFQFFANGFKAIRALFEGNTDDAVLYAKKALGNLVNVFVGIANAVISVINNLWTLIFDSFKGTVNAIGGFVGKIGEWIGQDWNLEWNANAPLIPMIPQYVPKLATGTVVPPNKQFMAVLGDNTREHEVVSPLSTIKQAVAEELANANLSGFNGRIEIPVILDGREIARAVREAEGNMGTQTIFGGFANVY